MFHIEVTATELATLQTALNHYIGQLQISVGQLAQAHGAAAPCVQDRRTSVLKADRLYDKLVAAPFKLLEPTK